MKRMQERYNKEHISWVQSTSKIADAKDSRLLGLTCYHCKEKIVGLSHPCFKNNYQVQISTCKACGDSFVVNWTKKYNQCCSYKCAGTSLTKYISPPSNYRITISCAWCGKPKVVWAYRLKNTKNICCSKECSHYLKKQYFVDHPEEREKRSAHMKKVLKGNDFLAVVREGHLGKKKGQNRIEALTQFLADCGVTYTGDYKHRVTFKDGKKKYPDFIVNPFEKVKKVVEVAGNYWHTKEEMEEIVLKYREVGYDCLVIWEDEILNSPNIAANKLYRFVHTITIGIFKFDKKSHTPIKAYEFDSGFDIFSTVSIDIEPGDHARVPCGITLILPYWMECQVRGRSGLANSGVLCHFGTIDSQFRGEIGPILFNTTKEPYKIKMGDKIAQLVISPKLGTPISSDRIELVEVGSFEDTARGTKGFGSTGR